MSRAKPQKLCPECLKPIVGCACGHRKASDEKMVHANCLAKYNHRLDLLKKEVEEKNKK